MYHQIVQVCVELFDHKLATKRYQNFNPADQELAAAFAKMDAVFGNLYGASCTVVGMSADL